MSVRDVIGSFVRAFAELPDEMARGMNRFSIAANTQSRISRPVAKLKGIPVSGDSIARYTHGGNALPVTFNFEGTR